MTHFKYIVSVISVVTFLVLSNPQEFLPEYKLLHFLLLIGSSVTESHVYSCMFLP